MLNFIDTLFKKIPYQYHQHNCTYYDQQHVLFIFWQIHGIKVQWQVAKRKDLGRTKSGQEILGVGNQLSGFTPREMPLAKSVGSYQYSVGSWQFAVCSSHGTSGSRPQLQTVIFESNPAHLIKQQKEIVDTQYLECVGIKRMLKINRG